MGMYFIIIRISEILLGLNLLQIIKQRTYTLMTQDRFTWQQFHYGMKSHARCQCKISEGRQENMYELIELLNFGYLQQMLWKLRKLDRATHTLWLPRIGQWVRQES